MYTLPKLSYKYNGLQPYIDTRTMKIHHTLHHQGYINKLNKYMDDVGKKKININILQATIKPRETLLRNNGGGHFNHSFFWKNMTNKVSQRKVENYPAIYNKIIKKWGDMETFYKDFEIAALSVFGSGWCWLILNGYGELEIVTTKNQDNPLMGGIKSLKHGKPILALDVWEHAYYLKYQNKRNSYIRAYFNVINWKFANDNL
jgi:Fe-Mn family superoxide dismutase